MIEDFLQDIQKPGRYIGHEWNVSTKKFEDAAVTFALCFPDLYEVGMSNLGIRIIYGLLNCISDVVCERVFACAADMEQKLRANNQPLFSLESNRSLRDFDIVGFSLGYELSFTNVLQILDLGGIPLLTRERDHTFPLVIAGGPCAVNPEPMHAFIDAFVIGEGEEVLKEIVDLYRAHKRGLHSGEISKDKFLFLLSNIEGVYVPSLRPPEGRYFSVRKRFIKDFEQSYFPEDWLVPYIQTVHDRISIEVMRGCPNTCRFCQARQQYYPLRQRSVETLMRHAQNAYQRSGYEEISLCGLSVSDYPYLSELSQGLMDMFKDKGVAVSLPSIKPTKMVGPVSGMLANVKRTSLTFAPEAASERLRLLLGKDFSVDSFRQALLQAYEQGLQHVKLYFMIGLPTETDRDLDELLAFCDEASKLRRSINKPKAQVNVSINALIPKPHTAMQWCGMLYPEEVHQRQLYLRHACRNRSIRLSFHHSDMSFLEAVFARGDRRLSAVILEAYRKGSRFDGWKDYFNLGRWQEAFSACGVDPFEYLKEKDPAAPLPWEFIDLGVSRTHLLQEYQEIRK